MDDGPIQRSDVIVVVGIVASLAVPGVALLLWAEARKYSDNQQNLAYLGGWLAVGGAGVVALLAASAAIRDHAPRRTQLAYATTLLTLSAALMVGLILVG